VRDECKLVVAPTPFTPPTVSMPCWVFTFAFNWSFTWLFTWLLTVISPCLAPAMPAKTFFTNRNVISSACTWFKLEASAATQTNETRPEGFTMVSDTELGVVMTIR